jgi:hypothetical protein
MITILTGRWCNIIDMNVHASCEDLCDNVTDSFNKEVGRVFDQFPRDDMNILLDDFNGKKLEKMFSNRQSGTRVHMKLVMTMELLEQ